MQNLNIRNWKNKTIPSLFRAHKNLDALNIQVGIASKLSAILVWSWGENLGLGLSLWEFSVKRWYLNLVYSLCEQVGNLVVRTCGSSLQFAHSLSMK